MSDLISREELKAEIDKCHITSGVKHQGVWNECVDSILRTINYIPPISILDHARAIKKYCENCSDCEKCKFSREAIHLNGTVWHKCRLREGGCPNMWDLPEGEEV